MSADFDALFAQVTSLAGGGFGHREHVHLTWLAVREHGEERAATVISDGLRQVTRYARMPQKYNETVSRAWVALIARHVREDDSRDFAAFVDHSPALLDKRLLLRFYRSSTLASPAAEHRGWSRTSHRSRYFRGPSFSVGAESQCERGAIQQPSDRELR